MKYLVKKLNYIKPYFVLILDFLCALGWSLILYANLGADPGLPFKKRLAIFPV